MGFFTSTDDPKTSEDLERILETKRSELEDARQRRRAAAQAAQARERKIEELEAAAEVEDEAAEELERVREQLDEAATRRDEQAHRVEVLEGTVSWLERQVSEQTTNEAQEIADRIWEDRRKKKQRVAELLSEAVELATEMQIQHYDLAVAENRFDADTNTGRNDVPGFLKMVDYGRKGGTHQFEIRTGHRWEGDAVRWIRREPDVDVSLPDPPEQITELTREELPELAQNGR